MERLRGEGVIGGYTARVSPEGHVIELLRRSLWVQECYRVTGDDYFQARVIAPGIPQIRQIVLDLRATNVVQSTRTTLALETLFEKSALGYLEPEP